MSQYFPKPYELLDGDINVKVDLSNYAAKTDKCWYFKFCIKIKFSYFKTEVDKLDINKLVPVPVDLSKLSDVVKNDVVKKTAHDKLVAKKIVLILADYTGKKELENKFLILVVLIKK